MRAPAPRWDHLVAMTDGLGLFEHAELDRPRREHGYCVDDVARGLVLVCRAAAGPDAERLPGLRQVYLAFLLAAQAPDGRVVNRRAADGSWHGPAEDRDCWGRALWAFGTAAADGVDDGSRAAFAVGSRVRSGSPRAMAYATLGAAAVLRGDPADSRARSLLDDGVVAVRGRPPGGGDWIWPEARLAYANAVFPEALLAAAEVLSDDALLAEGLRLLDWLVGRQLRDGHLSVVPVDGWGPEDTPPGFDQQPIEVAALAEAGVRAFALTRDPRWTDLVERCAAWFLGANDTGAVLYDEATGAGFDGLHPVGRNANRGAESTLAALSVLQSSAVLQQSSAALVPVR